LVISIVGSENYTLDQTLGFAAVTVQAVVDVSVATRSRQVQPWSTSTRVPLVHSDGIVAHCCTSAAPVGADTPGEAKPYVVLVTLSVQVKGTSSSQPSTGATSI